MASCSRCGQTMDAAAAYCSRCGAAMSSDWSRPAPRLDEPAPADKPALAPARSNTALIVVLGLLVVMLMMAVVVCGGVFFLARSTSAPAPVPARAVKSGPPPIQIPPPPEMPPLTNPDTVPPPDLPAPVAVEPLPVADRKVRLVVDAETWREGEKPFDIKAELLQQFAWEGIAVVDDENAEVDGIVEVSYEETEGDQYKHFGENEEGHDHDHGEEPEVDPQKDPMVSSNIHFSLKLKRKAGAAPCLELEQDSELGMMPLVTMGKTMHQASIDLFQRGDRAFAHSGVFVGTALGRADSAKHLAALLLDHELGMDALDTLQSAGFKPETAAERALWALAEGDLKKAAQEKEAAIPNLIDYYDKQDTWGDVDTQVEILQALNGIGGAAVEQFVLTQLGRETANRPENPEEAGLIRTEVVVELIEAAAAQKLVKAEADLQKLCGDGEPEVVAAAQKALKALGLPVPKITPKPKLKPAEDPDGVDENQ